MQIILSFLGKALIWCWEISVTKREQRSRKKQTIAVITFVKRDIKRHTKEPSVDKRDTMAAAMFWRAQPATGMSERGGSGLA